MPFPVNDAAAAMQKQAQQTETALQKVYNNPRNKIIGKIVLLFGGMKV
jgi:hypothetical protein